MEKPTRTSFGEFINYCIRLIGESLVAYITWNVLAPLYFDFLPEKYLHIPWAHIFILFLMVDSIVGFIKAILESDY